MQDRYHQGTGNRRLSRQRRILRRDQSLPTPGRPSVSRNAGQPPRIAVTRRIQAHPPGRDAGCPWHCWEFDLRTGQSWCDPDSVHARTYAVQIEPGAVWPRFRSRPRPFRSTWNTTMSCYGLSRGANTRVRGNFCRRERTGARAVIAVPQRRQRRSGGTAVRLRDVARQAGVSTASVSRASTHRTSFRPSCAIASPAPRRS